MKLLREGGLACRWASWSSLGGSDAVPVPQRWLVTEITAQFVSTKGKKKKNYQRYSVSLAS